MQSSIFIIVLRFSSNKSAAKEHMAGHNQWIAGGVADNVFLIVGSLKPQLGGAILAAGESLESIKKRVGEDPFVQHNVVSAEVLEIEPGQIDQRLSFLSGREQNTNG